MLTVAVSRLRELWPAAAIKVITSLLGRLEKRLPSPSFGVRPHHVAVTGDDAIEPAFIAASARVIERVHQCRLVVTGSYHAAVFAVAQGIPAVAVAASQYYRDKMSGLVDQFGEGCQVVTLDEAASLMSRLSAAIHWAWSHSGRVRPALIARATEQVARGRQAYARLPAMMR
jgi:colanic acid/amylovoran biosynthesis protein